MKSRRFFPFVYFVSFVARLFPVNYGRPVFFSAVPVFSVAKRVCTHFFRRSPTRSTRRFTNLNMLYFEHAIANGLDSVGRIPAET